MSILNKSKFKRATLDIASKRHHKFTRVSEEFINRAEYMLTRWLMDHISQLPSKGKTIK
jgi:hypothetical protein